MRERVVLGYVLGHSEVELRRLEFQAGLIEPITRQLLVEAGVGEGMRVLDVGTGRGDVAFLAAELVGENGFVLGIDRSEAAVAVARGRAKGDSRGNVSFVEGDPAGFHFTTAFDAIVGRYVLQFQREPAALLRRLADCLQSGGIVAFHEIDWTGRRSSPPVEVWDRCCKLVTDAIAAGGANLETGTQLPLIFAEAGLPAPSMRMSSIVGAGANNRDLVQRMSNLVLSLLPVMEDRGLVERGEFDEETLIQRIVDELSASRSFAVAGSEITAHCHLPADC